MSEDNTIIAAISTSGARTSSGKNAVGKMLKIRSDMYFLLLVDMPSRFVVLTERDMLELCQKEQDNGRVPINIQFLLADIPEDLSNRLRESRLRASDEVSPR